MFTRTQRREPLVQAFVDSWAAPRPQRLARMSERYTALSLGATLAALMVADLLGLWRVAAWWEALADWAPIGTLVTAAVVLGWQAALTHSLLGALELLRSARDGTGPRWALSANFFVNGFLWVWWGVSCLVLPGIPAAA